VEHYPYGEVRPDADSLTLPPSSIARRGLHLVLASETPLPDVVTPYTAIQAALRATIAREDSPSWAALQGGSSDRQIETLLDDDSSSFMRLFHNAKGDPDSQGAQTKAKASEFSDSIAEEPLYRPFLTTVDGQHARRRSRSSGDLLLTVPLLGAIDASSPSSHAPGKTSPGDSPPSRLVKQYSSGTLRPSPKTADTWDNFKFAGFGEGERESFELSPAIAQAALRPSQSSRVVSFGSDTSDRPPAAPHQGKGTFVVAQEGIIEIDDHFFLFVHDGQLDKVTLACWPSFALVRLRNPIPHANGDIECVLITLEHRPPARSFSPIPNSIERSASPAESTASRSLSFFRRSSSFGPRRSLFGSKPAPKTSASAYPLPVLAESGSSTPAGKEPLSAISAAPTEYTITEMGEMVKIAANKSPAAAPGSNDLPTIAAVLDPTHDTKASEWAYWAEGGGHLIFKYKGSHSAYSRQVLRLRKPTSPLSAHQEVATHWKETLLPKLLPAQLLLTSTPVKLNHQWARELLEGAEQVRPESRKLDSGNLAAAITGDMMGSLMDDTTAAGVDTETIFSVEIKVNGSAFAKSRRKQADEQPKWGFVPQANNISPPEAAGIKSKHSRYVLHRHYKREGLDDTFDPLDLFASDQARVQQALDGLWSIWKDTAGAKNNWRVYVNGKPIMPDQVNQVPDRQSGAYIKIDLLPGSADDSLVNRTAPFLLPALQASNVLPKLRDLQSSLDPVDISTLAQRFRDEHPDEKLFDPTIIAEPTIPELDTVVEKYCANPAGHSGWTLREQMIAYALSAIFKDCSIFVTIPLKQHGNKWIMEAGAKVKIIDLDLKDVGMLKKWYDLDEAIWRYWLDTHAVRGTSTSDEEDEPERTTTNSENGPSPTLRLSPSSLSAVDGSSTRAMFVPSQSASGQVTSTQPSTREASIDLTPETVRQTPMDAAAISPAKWSPEELAEGAPSAAAGGLSPEDALTATPSYLRDETDAASHAPVGGMAGKVTSDGTLAPGNGLSFPPTRSESPSAERKKRSLAPFEKRLPDEDATPTPILALDNASNNAATESPHSVDLGGAAVTHVATSLGAGAVDLAEGVDNADMDNAESVANGVVNDAAARPLPKAMGMLRGDSERTESTGTGTSGISAPVEDFFTPAADIPEPLLASVGVSSPETLAGAAKSTDGVKAIANRDSDDSDVPEGSDDTFGPGQSIPGMVDAQATPPSDSVLLSAPMKAAVQTMDSDQAIIPSSTSSASELVPDLADGHQVGHAGNNAADRKPADLGREDTLPSITAPEEHEAESEPSKYSQSSAVTTRAGSLQVDDHDSFDQAGDGLAEIRRPEDDGGYPSCHTSEYHSQADQPRGEA